MNRVAGDPEARRALDQSQQSHAAAASLWPIGVAVGVAFALVGLLVSWWIVAVGVVWVISPTAPGWWPIDEKWWLPGGWGTGSSLIISGLIALGLVVYSYREYHGKKPEKVEQS